MVFLVRLRHPKGTTRLAFKDNSATWKELQLQIQDVLQVAVAHQKISSKPLSSPSYISGTGKTLAGLNLKHGDMLHLGGAAATAVGSSASPSRPTTARTFKLTANCQHGPRGKCLHCAPVDSEKATSSTMTGKYNPSICRHGPKATCVNCSKFLKAAQEGKTKEDELPEWLCTHPETVFCPKCIPPADPADQNQPISCACDPKRGQSCIRCVEVKAAPDYKIDKIPFKKFLADRAAVCRFKHPASTTCPNCSPPERLSYIGDRNCKRGHKPWPFGVCISCAPKSAVLLPQVYRHCDEISVPAPAIKRFYQNWARASHVQRTAILLGKFVKAHQEHGVRAVVHGMYVPPQSGSVEGVKMLKDSNEETVYKVANALGVEPVGWIITTLPRSGKKYAGKVLMSGNEVRQAAKFQNRFKNSQGYSSFVTIVLEQAASVEPVAYQVSDQAVTLEAEGVFVPPKDTNMMKTIAPKDKEMVPSIIYRNKPITPGTEFLPDDFIVKVILATDQKERVLKHHDFPTEKKPKQHEVKSFFSKYSKEDYQVKLADFQLLIYLTSIIGWDLVEKVCFAIRDKKSLDKATKEKLDTAFLRQQLL